MQWVLKEIAVAMKTGSVREMAAILRMHFPLTLRGLIKQFLKEVKPRDPTNLQIVTGNGTWLTWTDPGAGQFFAATTFHFNWWVDNSSAPIAASNGFKETQFFSTFNPTTGHVYTLFVQSFNTFENVTQQSGVAQAVLDKRESSGGGVSIDVTIDSSDDD